MIPTESKQSLGVTLVAAVLVSAALAAVYYYGGVAGHADDTPLRAALVGTIGAVIAGSVAWRLTRDVYAQADADRLARWSAGLTGLAVVSLAGFWIGITVPVCAGAFAVGHRAAAAGRRGRGYTAMAVAALVIVASAVLSVLGET